MPRLANERPGGRARLPADRRWTQKRTRWRSLGQNVLATVRKGDAVVVLGRLIQRTFEDRQGIRRSVHEIDAIAVGPDLARCAADLHRVARSDAAAPHVGSDPVADAPAGVRGPAAA